MSDKNSSNEKKFIFIQDRSSGKTVNLSDLVDKEIIKYWKSCY